MKKSLIYIFLVANVLSSVVLFDFASVSAETVTQDYVFDTVTKTVSCSGASTKQSYGYMRGSASVQLADLTAIDISNFDLSKNISVTVSFDLDYNIGSNSVLSYHNSNNSEVYIQLGSMKYVQTIADGHYTYDFPWENNKLNFNGTVSHYVYNNSSISSSRSWNDTFVVSNLIVTLSQEVEDEIPSETESETPSETPTEMESETPSETPTETESETPSETPTETESETPSETPSDTENDGSGSSEDLTVNETAIYNALTAYFDDNPLDVVMVSDDGIDKELEDLTFEEVCLLGLLLLNLGSAILHIVGGRAWNK